MADRNRDKVLNAAIAYVEEGFGVVPFRRGEKVPVLGSWKKYQSRLPNHDELAVWFDKQPAPDIALVCGFNGLAGLDIDDPDLAERILSETDICEKTMVARTPSGGIHIHLLETESSKNGPIGGVGDIKAAGGLLISPPSLGRTWVGGCDTRMEVKNARRWAEQFLGQFGIEFEAHTKASKPTHSQKVSPSSGKVLQGGRHTALVSVAGRLRYQGEDPEAIAGELLRENQRRCRPPLEDDEVIQIALSMANYDPGPMPLTDYGNAERLVGQYGEDLHHSHGTKTWYVWRGTHWGENTDNEVERRANATARSIVLEAEHEKNVDRSKKLFAHARKSEGLTPRNNMIVMARDLGDVPIDIKAFDRHPYLLNVLNGTVDLQTGELLPHSRGDLITKIIPILYDPDAKAPRWEEFLDEVFEGREDVISYIHQAVGYSATAEVCGRCIFLAYGTGANGKSKFLDALLHVIGPYAIAADSSLLMADSRDSHTTGITDLYGVRVATTVETGRGRGFDERRLKWLTGEDRIRARKMYQDNFEFDPTHKFWIATNHKPDISHGGDAVWNRIKLIPFERVFAKEEQDPNLGATLQAEAQGILAWIVRGACLWYEGGKKLMEPDAVTEATAEYRQESDQLRRFLDVTCDFRSDLSIGSGLLYDQYRHWCEDEGEPISSVKEWASDMKAAGWQKKVKAKGNYWLGLGLTDIP